MRINLANFFNDNLKLRRCTGDTEFTHALVYFNEEDCTSVIPFNKLQSKNEDKCEVVWKRGQRYSATIIVGGKESLNSAFNC